MPRRPSKRTTTTKGPEAVTRHVPGPVGETLTFEAITALMRQPITRRSIVSHRRQSPAGTSGPVTTITMTPADVEARSRQLEAERLARR